MKPLIRALLFAAVALGLPAAAWAQSAPPTMPDKTVYGRLGAGTGSGPGQSIPLATLGAALAPFTFTPTGNGVDQNVLNTVTSNYSIATTDCGKTVQAGTGSTGNFTLTLPVVSGFAATCSVLIKNSDTAATKALSGFPADVNATLFASQSVGVKIVNGAWASFYIPPPQRGGFRTNLNGSNWTFTTPATNAYVLIPFSATAFNLGSFYTVYPGSYSTAAPPTNTIFKPGPGVRLVCFGAEVFVQSGASQGSNHNAIIKIIKDFTVDSSGTELSGTDVVEGQLPAYYGNTGSVAGVLSGCDAPAPTDVYGLFIYIDGSSGSSGGDSITVSGNNAHTSWSAAIIY